MPLAYTPRILGRGTNLVDKSFLLIFFKKEALPSPQSNISRTTLATDVSDKIVGTGQIARTRSFIAWV